MYMFVVALLTTKIWKQIAENKRTQILVYLNNECAAVKWSEVYIYSCENLFSKVQNNIRTRADLKKKKSIKWLYMVGTD